MKKSKSVPLTRTMRREIKHQTVIDIIAEAGNYGVSIVDVEPEIKLVLAAFRERCISLLRGLALVKVNPYLFAGRVKNPMRFAREYLNAKYSSSEESLFGNMIEDIARAILDRIRLGTKTPAKGIDGDVVRGLNRYLVSVKSGANWGNSSSTAAQGRYFEDAKTIIGSRGHRLTSVMLIMYGREDRNLKYADIELVGQQAWAFLSGDKDFYAKLIQYFVDGSEEFGQQIERARHESEAKLYAELCAGGFVLKNGEMDWPSFVKKACSNIEKKEPLC
jgi:hypothetical protein